MAMWRAGLTSPKLGKLIGVSGQTIRNWQDADHTAKPSHGDILALAVNCGVPVEALDPDHPQAGLVWEYRRVVGGPDGDGGEYAPGDSNPEPSGSQSLAWAA